MLTDDDLRKELARIAALQQGVLSSDFQERLQAEIKDYRQHLDSLLGKTIRVLYIISAFLVGATSILGFKTYSDIEDKVRNEVRDRVDAYVTKEVVDKSFLDSVRRHEDDVLVECLRVAESSAGSRRPVLSDREIRELVAILSDLRSPHFRDVLGIVSSSVDWEGWNGTDQAFADAILGHLEQRTGVQKETLSLDTRVDLINALGRLRYEPATNNLMAVLRDESEASSVKTAALNALPSLVRSEERAKYARQIPEYGSNSGLREARLHALFFMDRDLAVTEFVAASKVIDKDSGHLVATFIRDFIAADYSTDDKSRIVEAVAAVLGQSNVQLKYEKDWASFPFERGPTYNPHEFTIWVGRDGYKLPLYNLEVLASAVALVFEKTEANRRPEVFKALILPMVELGVGLLDFDAEVGNVGRNADPPTLQSGFRISLKDADGKTQEYLVTEGDVKQNSIVAIDMTGQVRQVPMNQLSAASFTWSDPLRYRRRHRV